MGDRALRRSRWRQVMLTGTDMTVTGEVVSVQLRVYLFTVGDDGVVILFGSDPSQAEDVGPGHGHDRQEPPLRRLTTAPCRSCGSSTSRMGPPFPRCRPARTRASTTAPAITGKTPLAARIWPVPAGCRRHHNPPPDHRPRAPTTRSLHPRKPLAMRQPRWRRCCGPRTHRLLASWLRRRMCSMVMTCLRPRVGTRSHPVQAVSVR